MFWIKRPVVYQSILIPCLEISSSDVSAYLKAWIQFTLSLYAPLCNFPKLNTSLDRESPLCAISSKVVTYR